MLAEQQESRRGFYQIRGLALTTATSPWDAGMLERWARCLKCPRSRQMLAYTAHCLRAPALHDKYRVHKIMQVDSKNNKGSWYYHRGALALLGYE